jgi:hypothetical protein
MDTLHNLLMSAIQEHLTVETLGTRLITDRFKEIGITLTDEQRGEIKERLAKGQFEDFKIQIDDSQLLNAKIQVVDGQPKEISISVNDEDAIDNLIERFVEEVFTSAQGDIADLLLSSMKATVPESLAGERDERTAFEANLRQEWGDAFDLLETFICIVRETGSEFNEEFRPYAVKSNDYVFDALIRLHARACQVAFEVLVLLKSGFADGAHARWRTLHEIAVIAMMIAEHGNQIAERYLLHDGIESYKAAQEYERYHRALGDKPMSQEELSELKSIRDALIAKYRRNFEKRFGWASEALGKDAPDFADIERDVGLERMRPYYTMASYNVHANTKGIFYKLGRSPFQPNLMLAGASIFGLADPGQGTAIALFQIAAMLLTAEPNFDRLVTCRIMQKLADEVQDKFIQIQSALEKPVADRTSD